MNCRGNPISIHMGRCEIISVGRERASVRERQKQRGEDLGVMKEGRGVKDLVISQIEEGNYLS